MICNSYKCALPVAKRALPLCSTRCLSSTKEKFKPQSHKSQNNTKPQNTFAKFKTNKPSISENQQPKQNFTSKETIQKPLYTTENEPTQQPVDTQIKDTITQDQTQQAQPETSKISEHIEQPQQTQQPQLPLPQTHLQRVDPLWKDMVKVFGERNALTFLDPLLLEEALSHRLVAVNLPTPPPSSLSSPHIPVLVSDRLVYLGHALAELQLTEYYMDLLPRGAALAARICLYKKNLYEVGQRMGLDKLMHHQMLVTNSYQALHHLPETKRLELATAESVLALLAATHLHHTKANTSMKPLFSHRYLALPLTLKHLIKEHRPKQVLDAFLRSRRNPAHQSHEPRAWDAQTQPPAQVHSTFAIYKVLNEVKSLTPLFTVGVYVDGKLLATEYGTSAEEAEEMAAVRALEILRSNALQAAVVAREQESE